MWKPTKILERFSICKVVVDGCDQLTASEDLHQNAAPAATYITAKRYRLFPTSSATQCKLNVAQVPQNTMCFDAQAPAARITQS